MTDLTTQIADIIARHPYTATPASVTDPRVLRCVCGTDIRGLTGYTNHVAAVLVDELQLQQEWGLHFAAVPDEKIPERWETVTEAQARRCAERLSSTPWPSRSIESRLVGPWRRTNPEEKP